MLTARENLLKAYNHEILERIPIYQSDIKYWMPPEIRERGPEGGEGLGGGTGYDWFGNHWTFSEVDMGTTPTPGYGPILTDVTKWREQIKFPDLSTIDWKAAWERDGADPEEYEGKLRMMIICSGPLEQLHTIMGFDEGLMATILEPEACKEFFEAIIDYKIEMLEGILEYYPLDIVEQHDDYGHNNNSFISLDQFRELLMPAWQKYAKFLKKKGVIFQLHSCGKNEGLVPGFIEAGVQSWSSCQRINNHKAIVHEYCDKIILNPGIMFPEYDGMELTEEEKRRILDDEIFSICKGGAYIPDMWDYNFYDTLVQMVAERPDFYEKAENCILP